MGRLTEAQAESYFANRQAHGFNTLGWVDVACAGNDYRANKEGTTPDGIRPFTGYVAGGTDYMHYDLTKPNEAYFTRLDHVVNLAVKHGLLIFIDPIETIGWLSHPAQQWDYSRLLLWTISWTRYKGFPQRRLVEWQRFQFLARS